MCILYITLVITLKKVTDIVTTRYFLSNGDDNE